MAQNNTTQPASEPRYILATRFSALGDVTMTIPALYDACLSNPDVRIIMVTRASMTGMFINRPDNLIIEGVELDRYKGPSGMFRLMGELTRRYPISAYVDLHDVLRTRMLRIAARLRRIRTVSIDKGRSEKKRLTRRSGKIMLPLRHSIDRYRDALAKAGLKIEPHFEGLFAGTTSDPSVYAAISAPKADGEVWIGIAPFAKHEGKIYPIHLMEQVLRELSGRHDTKIFLFGGGPYEQKILGEWARKYPSTVSLAGRRHGFGVELALLHDLDAMISMDSANMHLASLAGTPTVAIWGATHPYCGFSGWRVPDDNNLQLPIPCRPCSVFGNKPCLTGDFRCLSHIRPDVITARVDALCNGNV